MTWLTTTAAAGWDLKIDLAMLEVLAESEQWRYDEDVRTVKSELVVMAEGVALLLLVLVAWAYPASCHTTGFGMTKEWWFRYIWAPRSCQAVL